MSDDRLILRFENLDDVRDWDVKELVRVAFRHPLRGGAPLREVRAALHTKGSIRFSCSPNWLFADVDPAGDRHLRIGLDVIARSDPMGLERMITSVINHVDEIVIGVDSRSENEDTLRVAEAFADKVWTLDREAADLSEEDWKADKINFAAARNSGREQLLSPWALVLDTDEFLEKAPDLREEVKRFDEFEAVGMMVAIGGTLLRDSQRLAKTTLRWKSGTHNNLVMEGPVVDLAEQTVIVHDARLRSKDELRRRTEQRRNAAEDLRELADGGDLHALFHYAKQLIGDRRIDEAVKYTKEFRSFAEVRGHMRDDRAHLAVGVSEMLYFEDRWEEAELWALRALLDGPRIEAFGLLGDIAEDRGDLEDALFWYEAACLVPQERTKLQWESSSNLRWGRREGLRRALGKAEGNPDYLVPVGADGKPLEDATPGGNGATGNNVEATGDKPVTDGGADTRHVEVVPGQDPT